MSSNKGNAQPDVQTEETLVTQPQFISKREYFAAMALQGMLAAGNQTQLSAEFAVRAADALIAELGE